MNSADLIKYLRLSVDVKKSEDSTARDDLYLKLSDDDLLLYLEVAKTREFADEDLNDFPQEYVYPLVLLAQKALYLALALKHASFVDLMADDNNQIKKSQWFKHYMQLADNMDKAWQAYIDEGGAGGFVLESANTYLSTRYYTSYNYEKEVKPTLKAKVDSISTDSIEISWKSTFSRFMCYKVFVLDKPVSDYYSDITISSDAKEIATITDPHIKRCRIRNCTPDTAYYIVVTVTDWAGVTIYHEVVATTPPVEDGDDTDGGVAEASL